MTFPEGFLINPDMFQRLRFTSRQTSFDSSVHDPVDFIPAQLQMLGHRLLTCSAQPVDRQTCKQQRETAPLFCPWQLYIPRTVLVTVASWRISIQDRLILAGIQMPPSSHRLMVVQVAQGSAFRACPLNANRMVQKNMNLTLFQFQFHAFNKQGIGNSKNLFVKLSVLNRGLRFGAFPIQLRSTWAEDRAMLGSNPSADSGPKTERGVTTAPRFAF
jgi:hypothetical protein